MSTISYKVEVQTEPNGKFTSNALRFATREEAEMSARELMSRWLLVRDCRAAESKDPVNYRFENGQNVRIEPEADLT